MAPRKKAEPKPKVAVSTPGHDIVWIDTSRKGEATWRCMCMESNTVRTSGTTLDDRTAAAVEDHRAHLRTVTS